jgi:hypothetical protein
MLSPPETYVAEESGMRELIAFPKEDFVELQGSMIAREALIKSDRPFVESFVRAMLKGLRHAHEKPTDAIKILGRYLKFKKEEYAARNFKAGLPALTTDGTVSTQMQEKVIRQVIDRVGLSEPPPLDTIFDYAMTRRIYNELKANGWKPK